AFVDPKGSHIEIIQAVGRAIRQAPNKEKGYIIVPVLLDADIDLMDEDNIEQAFENSCFGPVWNVLKALKTHDDMVSEQLDNLRIEMGRGRLKNPAKLLDKVTLILNDAFPIDGSEFANSLSPKILPIFNRKVIKQISDGWYEQFGALLDFREEHGHCKVPRSHFNLSLYAWVRNQREYFKKGKLVEDRIARLEELGFVWDVTEEAWEKNFLELKRFREEHGHCKVPWRYPKNPQLASWIFDRRKDFNRGDLSEDRIARLEEIGFVWNVFEEEWEEKFMELKRFREEHGHCRVPWGYSKNPSLYVWVSHQRDCFKKGELVEDRIGRLEEIGFVWDILEGAWEENFMELKRFREEHGHCKVPRKYSKNPQLASWVHHQREYFKKGKLAEDRIGRLNEIGFVWDVFEEAWEENFMELKRFREEHGHCNVPQRYFKNPSLGAWVSQKRNDFKKGDLSEDRIARLEEIGFVWNVLKES
ncbi:MAG: Helicase associated domain protein, partial [Chlamydia suis]|nr:Helicase associated domain protein [Chlamydia suis]